MVKKSLELVWSPTAKKQLREAYDYIKKDSLSSAKLVRDTIVEEVERLKLSPEIFELDKFKDDNSGNYRAFEKYRYRIAYKYTDTEVHVLRVRHTSREPLSH